MSHDKRSRSSESTTKCPHHPVDLDRLSAGADFLQNYEHVIFDCDGTLYVDETAVLRAAETVNGLKQMGKKVIFATNSSIKSRTGMAAKLARLGFQVKESECFPSSFAAAVYLKSIGFPSNQKVFVVGMSGIVDELAAAGIRTLVDRDPNPSADSGSECKIRLERNVSAVVVGYDNQFTFTKLAKACSYANQANCRLICCNGDDTYPSRDPRIVNPGPGKLIKAIAADDKQVLFIGKPTEAYFNLILESYPEMNRTRTLMIGDRLNTDMVFARRNGMDSLFVQTGLGTIEQMRHFEQSSHSHEWHNVPDFYAKSVASLLKFMK